MSERRTNPADSVRRQLLDLARKRGEDFQFVLNRFALERLLARLARSRHADRFVLKGAMLFALWTEQPHRATKDLDLLGRGDNSVEGMIEIFKDVCRDTDKTDGMVFEADSVEGVRIKEEQDYEAVRIRLGATLGSARLRAQVDIGFGDAIHPAPELIGYPSLIDLEPARIHAYPKETVIAEKFEAMVKLGIVNSRMKDFYDIWFLIKTFSFESRTLQTALRATFERRETPLPSSLPLALTNEFESDQTKHIQWAAFLSKGRLVGAPPRLAAVLSDLRRFFAPLVAPSTSVIGSWAPGGPWHPGTGS